jgi:CBS domain-containing protein
MLEPLEKLTSDAPRVVLDTPVRAAVEAMAGAGVGALPVMDGTRLAGVFTEGDVARKVVALGLDAARTPVREVMSTPPLSVPHTASRATAIQAMVRHEVRHIALTDDRGGYLGMLSLRVLLGEQVERLRREIASLASYLAADGPGG